MPSGSGPNDRIGRAFLRRLTVETFSVNERRLLDLMRREGPISRAEMARRTDLAMQSVVRLIDGLIERGFARAGGKVALGGPGQPSTVIELVADAAFTMGASIMADAIAIVLMNLSGQVLAETLDSIDASDRATVAAHLHRTVVRLMGEAGIDRSRLFGVGVATSGYFVDSARINTPYGMSEWALRDLETELGDLLDLPVWVENDGNAAAVGESLFGAGRHHGSFAYLYIAAGLGGGVIVDGLPFRGVRGNAGEFTGLLPVAARADRPTLTLLLEMLRAGGAAVGTIGEMLADFDMGQPGVDAWLVRTRPAATAILSAIGAVLDPEAIVLGGRIPRALAARMAEQADYYAAPLRDRERPFPVVLPAEAPGDAAALGAASIPLMAHFFR